MGKLRTKAQQLRQFTRDRIQLNREAGKKNLSGFVRTFRDKRQYYRLKPPVRVHGRRLLKVSGLGLGYGVLIEPYWVELTSHEIQIPNLSSGLEGYKVVHLSDIHHNLATSRQYHKRIVSKVNSLDADMIIITGDFMTYDPEKLKVCFQLYENLRSHDGVYVVRGNHDYYASLPFFQKHCEDVGFHFIENEHRVIKPNRTLLSGTSDDDTQLVIAGVEDLWEGQINLRKAFQGAPEIGPRLLLAHHPMTADLIEREMDIDVVFSGHTHGGQIKPFQKVIERFSDSPKKYIEGWADAPNTRVYTSRGIGTSVFRFRWNCRPEIAVHSLTKSVVPCDTAPSPL